MYNMTVFNAVQCKRGPGGGGVWGMRGGARNRQVKGVHNRRLGVRCEQLSHENFRFCLWNVGTVRGRSIEVVQVMSRCKVDICDLFYKNLQGTLAKISASVILFVCGDVDGHIGKNADGYEAFMMVEDLEDIIWRVREFLNLLVTTT